MTLYDEEQFRFRSHRQVELLSEYPRQSLAKEQLHNMTNKAWNRIRPKTEKPNTLGCPSADIIVRDMKESNDYRTFHFSRHYVAIELLKA